MKFVINGGGILILSFYIKDFYVFINGDVGVSTNEFSVLGILGLSFLYIFES